MSNFRSKAFNPSSKRVEDAEYCDDYYGRHRYGIRFDDGCVHPEAQCGIDAAATAIDSLQARVKELERDSEAFQRHEQTLRDNGIASHSEAVVRVVDAESRATRLQQERDEAYERAIQVADKKADDLLDAAARLQGYIGATKLAYTEADLHEQAGTAIKALVDDIRRLAGPEKEEKE